MSLHGVITVIPVMFFSFTPMNLIFLACEDNLQSLLVLHGFGSNLCSDLKLAADVLWG